MNASEVGKFAAGTNGSDEKVTSLNAASAGATRPEPSAIKTLANTRATRAVAATRMAAMLPGL